MQRRRHTARLVGLARPAACSPAHRTVCTLPTAGGHPDGTLSKRCGSAGGRRASRGCQMQASLPSASIRCHPVALRPPRGCYPRAPAAAMHPREERMAWSVASTHGEGSRVTLRPCSYLMPVAAIFQQVCRCAELRTHLETTAPPHQCSSCSSPCCCCLGPRSHAVFATARAARTSHPSATCSGRPQLRR